MYISKAKPFVRFSLHFIYYLSIKQPDDNISNIKTNFTS